MDKKGGGSVKSSAWLACPFTGAYAYHWSLRMLAFPTSGTSISNKFCIVFV